MWFAAWDHIIGGDTEIRIFFPAPPEIDMPYDFDGIYIDMNSWDDAKAENWRKSGSFASGQRASQKGHTNSGAGRVISSRRDRSRVIFGQ
jgi:hypothetical protein